ncbi:MAG: hypothetical protein GXP32_03140 [Kiritimatiellaeota bacterium]|nr:hypothetical protein [Kiritimatiellota bacterium]
MKWSLRYAGKTLAAGEVVVPSDENVGIRFVFPKLDVGVTAATEFRVTVAVPGKNADIKKLLYFYGSNPFVGYEKALKSLGISVWEANGEEKLSEWLESLGVPFAKIADLEQGSGKILLVSGVNFESNPDVFSVLAELAAKGTRVYVFNPSPGTVPLPLKGVKSIRLSDSGIIREIDKKLDAEAWGNSRIADSKMRLATFADGVGLELVKQATNDGRTSAAPFSFFEIRVGKGSLTMVTWNILKNTNISPTPALILKKWLLAKNKK